MFVYIRSAAFVIVVTQKLVLQQSKKDYDFNTNLNFMFRFKYIGSAPETEFIVYYRFTIFLWALPDLMLI